MAEEEAGRRIKTRTVQVPPPYSPAKYEVADLVALQALQAGKATPMQQQRALKWIIEECADTYGLGWHPDGEGAAAFVAGRRFTGIQIVKCLKLNPSIFTAKEK